MKVTLTALLALAGTEMSLAFLPSHSTFRQPNLVSVRSMVKDAPTGTDVSVPYDAGARLAYDEWREQFGKGIFDEKRFKIFKTNYETITVANVSAKKKARDDGTSSLTLMSLNEYGDLTEEEYKQLMSSGSKTISTDDVLSKAVENAELQSEASSALSEAADAVAEEEKLLAEKLGINSVEELEIALDSLEGIAPDGGELDSENIAREARIRDSYLKWCKDFEKEPDETRFQAFSNNFLLMEQYAQETKKEMNLNEFADFTKEEYEAMQNKKTKDAEPSRVEEKLKEVAAAAAESVEEQLKQAADALRLAALALGDEKDLDEAQLEIRRQEREREEKEAAKEREQRAKAIAERAKAEAERRKVIDQERAERLKKQEALMAKKQAELEASVIAAARADEEQQARASARAKLIEAQASALARKQAQESEAKLKRAAQVNAGVGRTQPKKKVKTSPSIFASFVSPPAETKATPPKPVLKMAPAVMAKQSKEEPTNPFSFFTAPKVSKTPSSFSVFPIPAATSAPPKVSPQMKATPAPAKPSFSFFSPPSPAPAPVPPKVTPVAPQMKVAPAKPSFSFFSAPAPAPVPPKVEPVAEKKAPSPFSFFNSPTPAPKVEVKVPAPVVEEKKSAFSFFSAPAANKEAKSAPKVDVKVPNQRGSISIFGATPKAETKVPNKTGTLSIFGVNKAVVKKDVVVPTRSGTLSVRNTSPPKKVTPEAGSKSFSLFGSTSKAGSKAVVPPPKPVQSKPTLSLFGTQSNKSQSTAKAPPKNVPVLSRWRQNADGSITGIVSNSPNFKTGTQITTSPVGKGAKSGLVKTGSGSQYFLS